MQIIELFEESITLLRVNKMRTLLSILGIVIGVGSVIALMSLGQSSQASVTASIKSLGSNLIMVRSGNSQQGFLRQGSSNSSTLKLSDAEAIKSSSRITTVSGVGADYTSRAQVTYGANNTNTSITGVFGDYFSVRNIEISSGTNFSQEQNDNYQKVAVLGTTVVEDLFGNDANPIGQTIRINGTSFKVVGVMKSKGSSGFGNADDVVYIPINIAQKNLFGGSSVNTIYISAKTEDDMDAARNQVGFLLLVLHRIDAVENADFTLASQEDILSTASSITGTFTTLLAGIAAISLIVGGIGIMNIMLVTVTERTMEIGLRKSLGAKRKVIIMQFLIEAVILTIVGGIIGVIIGVGVSYIIMRLMSLPQTLSWVSILLSVGVSSLIGIVFGWYPAQKAAKLQPIEALRYE